MTKEEIQAQLRVTRQAISRDTASLRRELDYKSKLKATIRKRPFAWFGGAAALGWWIAGPKTKKRVVTKTKYVGDAAAVKSAEKTAKATAKTAGHVSKLGIVIAIVKFLFPYFRPMLSQLANEKLAEYSQKYAAKWAR